MRKYASPVYLDRHPEARRKIQIASNRRKQNDPDANRNRARR